MARRNSTKFQGVFWMTCITNGKEDKTYYIAYKDNFGKRREVKVGKYSEGIRALFCKNKRDEEIQKIRLGEEVAIKHKKRKSFTFNDAFEHYLEWAKINKKSWTKDKELFENHLSSLAKCELIDLESKDFEKIKKDRFETHSLRTIEYILSVARQVINFSIKYDLVKNYTNPISNGRVKLPKPNNEKIGFLTYQQASQLLKELKDREESPLAYNLTVLLLFTGARFIEVASLTWKDINFDTNLIYFKSTKNGNSRHIHISDIVLDVLNSLPKDTKLVIPSTNDKQIERMPKQWQIIVDKLIHGNKESDTKHRITVHNLRHTHASWMALEGADILQIKEQLGHKKLDMTLRYAHLIPSKRHKIIQTISEKYSEAN